MVAQATVYFRVDASRDIGAGHAMRCLSLAQGYGAQGYRCIFVMAQAMDQIVDLVNRRGFIVERMPESDGSCSISGGPYRHSSWLRTSERADADSFLAVTDKYQFCEGIVVVDHYAIAKEWETAVSCRYDVLAIDDLNDRPHTARWVLDQTHGKLPKAYDGLIAESSRLLLGAGYALLSPSYTDLREKAEERAKERGFGGNVLVSLGGTYNHDLCLTVVTQIAKVQGIDKITLVMGAGGENYLPQWHDLAPYPNLELVTFTEKMPELLLQCDLCIGAAGSSSWERCALGIPSISVVIAENQKAIGAFLDESGATVMMDVCELEATDRLCSSVELLIQTQELKDDMASAALSVCDGKGVERVVAETLELKNA